MSDSYDVEEMIHALHGVAETAVILSHRIDDLREALTDVDLAPWVRTSKAGELSAYEDALTMLRLDLDGLPEGLGLE